MLDSNARVVRGLCIATIILSGIAILCVFVAIIFTAMAGVLFSDPTFIRELADEIYYQSGNSVSISTTTSLMQLGIGIIILPLVWVLLCSVVPLVGCIITLRSNFIPEKLNSAFGWAIGGAVASFLSGSMVAMVLLIIAAVYLNKMKKLAAMPYGAYGQPVNGQPVAPYGQPGAYGQPAVPYQQPPVSGSFTQASATYGYNQIPSQSQQPSIPNNASAASAIPATPNEKSGQQTPPAQP